MDRTGPVAGRSGRWDSRGSPAARSGQALVALGDGGESSCHEVSGIVGRLRAGWKTSMRIMRP